MLKNGWTVKYWNDKNFLKLKFKNKKDQSFHVL